MKPRTILAALLALFTFAGNAIAATPELELKPITVFAAASLKESLDAVAAEWTTRSSQKVVVSYAASSALAKQIEQDAPADVFISADEEWMDYLAQRKRVDTGSRFDLVGNRLVLVAPSATAMEHVDLKPDAFGAALGEGRLAVADVESVPAGRYAKQALQSLGLWDAAAAHLAPGENVRAALAFVARGEVPLGIVYATDARAEPRVRVVAQFPPKSHARIVYPAARIARGDAESSRGFLDFLRSKRARAIFQRAGFTAP
jgi:molybdate transport system substrate-binding protein